MNKRKALSLIVILLTFAFLFATPLGSIVSATAETGSSSSWTTINLPQPIGVGRILSVAVVDAKTAFAVVSQAMTATPGGPTSCLLMTSDGGVSWVPRGNFDPANPKRPAELSDRVRPANLILIASPNYLKDNTLFLAVVYDLGTPNQIYWSKDGGGSFQLLGGAWFPITEVIKAVAVSPNYSPFADYTIAIGTVNPIDGEAGNLYLYTSQGWQRVGRNSLDVYAMRFVKNHDLVIIATPDTQKDQSFYEYRLFDITERKSLPYSPPDQIRIGLLAQSSNETEQSFGIAVPSDWLPGTKTDTNLISYSAGGNSPSGKIYRRTGTIADYKTVYTSSTAGFHQIVMEGSSEGGSAYAAGEVTAGNPPALICSPAGHAGEHWSLITSGADQGIDGTGETVIGLGLDGALYVGTGGTRGGIFISLDRGSSWRDSLCSDSYPYCLDWQVMDKEGILVLMLTSDYREGALFKTDETGTGWIRIKRLSLNVSLWGSRVYPSPEFATDSTIYLLTADGQIIKLENNLENNGQGWQVTVITAPDPNQKMVTLRVKDAKTLWAQLSDNRIAYTSDGGNSWTKSTFSPPDRLVSITVSPDGNTLAGMTKNSPIRVVISRDGGLTWSLLGGVVPGTSSSDVTFSPNYQKDRMIYATTKSHSSDGGLYYLKDDGAGANWLQKVATASFPISLVIEGRSAYPDAYYLGKAEMVGAALYAPAGYAIIATFDINRQPVEWHILPLVSPAQSRMEKISLRKIGEKLQIYTAGDNTICTLTDSLQLAGMVVKPPIAKSLSPIEGKYAAVLSYDALTASWLIYNPLASAEANTLKELKRGEGYWIYATESVTFRDYSLIKGWNLIGWLGE